MHTLYETERLYLQIMTPTETNAKMVVNFYKNNKDIFEPYELDRHVDFYTIGYHLALLQCEYNMFVKSETVRFWIFSKESPDFPIGTVCYHDIRKAIYQSCDLGYKLDKNFWHMGYATEAIVGSMGIMSSEYDIHRVNAYVMPENNNSLKVLRRIGFEDEGLQHEYIYMHGKWQDHFHLAYIFR